MACCSPRPGAQALPAAGCPFDAPLTSSAQCGHRACRQPDFAAQMLVMARGATETALRFLEDGLPTEALDVGQASARNQAIDLTCICPCCNKDFQLLATNYATVGSDPGENLETKDEWKRDVEDLQQQMEHARELHRTRVEDDIFDFSSSKLHKVVHALDRVQSQISDGQMHRIPSPGRDAKKRQYLALYEEMLQQKYEIEMTTMMQQRIDGTSSDDELKIIAVPPGTIDVPSPAGTVKAPAFASRVDARDLNISIPSTFDARTASPPREVTRLSPRGRVRATSREGRISPSVRSVSPSQAPTPAVTPRRPVISPRQLGIAQTDASRTIVPLSSPRADPQIRVYKKIKVGQNMYPDFRYSGNDAAPGFTPSVISSTDSPAEVLSTY